MDLRLRRRSPGNLARAALGLSALLVAALALIAVISWWSRQAQGGTGVNDQQLLIPGMPVCLPLPTMEAVVEPQGESGSPFGLAWFHKPPEDGTSPQDLASTHRYIHLTGPADIPFRNELREAGYTGPILTYVNMNAVEGPGPYRSAKEGCNDNYSPLDNQLAFLQGDFCKLIHPNERWFLHNGAGERIVDDYFGSGRYSYMMNPADPGWRDFAASRLKLMRDEWLYDGIWMDNLDLDMGRLLSEMENSDGVVREFSRDEDWREATQGWLAAARAAIGEHPLWANIVGGGLRADAWDAYAPYLDGAMDESFGVRWLDGKRSDEQWKAQIERAQRWLALGKGLIMVGQGAREDQERMRFTLASYLLVARGGSAHFRYTRFDSYYSGLWLYPEYEVARRLGAPVGACHEIGAGVWRRDFERGYVEVDLRAQQGKLVEHP